ncbi:hypothetical protein AB1L42_13350 [Thalassoglobus sp. JC818]|uniref:anti-sigma factor family protein n=1 Tax=Thalassoglobus sp. JC818 TaxID=3232136 RepID=UPI003459341A
MSFVYSPEMLSAYLDGELTDAEKQFLEELLQQSPELQAELDEIKNVSLRVQEVPRLSAPVDLQSQILEAVKGQSQGVKKAGTAAPKRSRFSWLASSIAVCLGIGVTVWMLQKNQNPSDSLANGIHSTMIESKELAVIPVSDSPVNSTTSFQTDASGGRRDLVASTMEFSSNGVNESLVLADQLSTQPSPEFTDSDGISSIEELSMLAGAMPTEPQQSTPTVVSLSAKDLAQRLKTLTDIPDRGEDLSVATVHAGTPIIVDFTVVDIQKTLGEVEILVKSQASWPANMQDIEMNSQTANDEQFTVVVLDLEEPKLETVLNSVEAVSAVMYVEEDAYELLRETDLSLVNDDLSRQSGIASAASDLETRSDPYSESRFSGEAAESMFSATSTPQSDVNSASSGLGTLELASEQESRNLSQFFTQAPRRFRFELSPEKTLKEGFVAQGTVTRGLIVDANAQPSDFIAPEASGTNSVSESTLNRSFDAGKPSSVDDFGISPTQSDSFLLNAATNTTQTAEMNADNVEVTSPKAALSSEPNESMTRRNSGLSYQVKPGAVPAPALTPRQQEQKIRAFLLLREIPE